MWAALDALHNRYARAIHAHPCVLAAISVGRGVFSSSTYIGASRYVKKRYMLWPLAYMATLEDKDLVWIYFRQNASYMPLTKHENRQPSSSFSAAALGQCAATCSGCIDRWLPAILAPHRYGYEAAACLGVQPHSRWWLHCALPIPQTGNGSKGYQTSTVHSPS